MKVIASMMIAGVSAQFYPTQMNGGFPGGFPGGFGYPASYGMSTGFGYGGGFGGFGGGYGGYGGYGGGYGDYGRECRKGVTSDDLNGYARCYCDKNHRDEDFCNEGKVGSGDCQEYDDANSVVGFTSEVIKALDDYYDDIFDEDCVERSSPPANVRRCRQGIYSKDLPSSAACWCDGNHKKDVDDLEDLDDCDKLLNTAATAGPVLSASVNDEFWVAMHYEWDEKDVEKACVATTTSPSPAVYDAEDEGEDFEKFDPNCIERYGGNYGGYGMGGYGFGGGYGGFGMGGGYGGFGYNTGFGGNWGMQMQAPATTEGATTAPQFNFGGNQFGSNWGYPALQWGR